MAHPHHRPPAAVRELLIERQLISAEEIRRVLETHRFARTCIRRETTLHVPGLPRNSGRSCSLIAARHVQPRAEGGYVPNFILPDYDMQTRGAAGARAN
jgi:hypothetical protein